MNKEQPKKKSSWSSLLSFGFFLLIVAGRPIANLVNQLVGSANLAWANILPFVVGVLVLATIVFAVGRALAGTSQASLSNTPPSLPMPTTQAYDASVSQAPRFEPIVSPVIVVVGVVGLVVLGGIGLYALAQLP